MLPDHQLHLLVVLPYRTDFARQDRCSLFRTQLLELCVLEEVCEGVFDAALFLPSEILLHFDAVLCQLDDMCLLLVDLWRPQGYLLQIVLLKSVHELSHGLVVILDCAEVLIWSGHVRHGHELGALSD